MKKTIRLTESELVSLIEKVIQEQTSSTDFTKKIQDAQKDLNSALKGKTYIHLYEDLDNSATITIKQVFLEDFRPLEKGFLRSKDKIKGNIVLDVIVKVKNDKGREVMNNYKIYTELNTSKKVQISDIYDVADITSSMHSYRSYKPINSQDETKTLTDDIKLTLKKYFPEIV